MAKQISHKESRSINSKLQLKSSYASTT